MKILLVFIDMLRPNLLNLYDASNSFSVLDDKFNKIGGVLYTNCFTPGPDTPRSLACLWSGKYPFENGCDKRTRYPKFYLKNKEENLLEKLKKDGFSFNFFTNPNERKIGILPNRFESIGFHNDNFDLEDFLRKAKFPPKSFTFISISDFHWALDDYGANKKGVDVGFNKVFNSLGIIEDNLDFNNFDLVIFFSDHGMKFDYERFKEPRYKILNRDRSNVFLLVRSKNDNSIYKNEKLCSIMDINSTIAELIGVPSNYSLFKKKEIDFLVAEDHDSFKPEIDKSLGLWAVIKKDGIYYRTLYSYFFENKDVFKESPKELDLIIGNHSNYFKDYMKEVSIMDSYNKMNLYRDSYSDGTKRKTPFFRKMENLIKRKVLLRILSLLRK